MFRRSYLKLISNQLKASFSTTADAPVVFNYQKNSCSVLLNKPKALNAVDLQMVRLLNAELEKWSNNSDLKAIIFKGAGGKAFCAGGDIKSLYEAKTKGVDPDNIRDTFFREEYELDYKLSTIKPYQIAIWDGIVMGGGVGVSIHAPIKIATEKSMFAMPEAKIGLFTDVAGGYFLSRLSHNLGYYLGLTGQRLKGAELVQAGLANYYVKSENVEALEKDLVENTNKNSDLNAIKAIVSKYAEKIDQNYANSEWIEKVFGQSSVEGIVKALQETKENKELADKLLSLMSAQSPLSMKVIHEQIKRGGKLDLKENFKMDFRLVTRFMQGEEFYEGVRCTLVDKNDKPKWTYKTLEEVPKEEVEKLFAPITNELK